MVDQISGWKISMVKDLRLEKTLASRNKRNSEEKCFRAVNNEARKIAWDKVTGKLA